jgi:spore maturation protein CgeB
MPNCTQKFIKLKGTRQMKKVAIIGKDDIDSLAWHIDYTLNKMDFEAKIFKPSGGFVDKIINKKIQFYMQKLSSRYDNYVHNQLVSQIVQFQADLVIVILRSIPPDVISKLKKHLNVKVIFWTGDAFINLERGYALVSNYDAWFVKDTYMEDFMKQKLGLNVHLLPECINPDVHKAPENVEFGSKNEITVAGTLYPYRAKILEQLIGKFKVEIYGTVPRWMDSKWKKLHTGKYIRLEEKSNVFYSTKINLNTLHYGEVNAGNCRLFEIAGAGGFQICDRKKEITNYFEEDKEIVFFDSTGELVAKIKYYLAHPAEAEIIAINAYKRAHNEHTYEHRIKKVFEIIGFDS